MQMKNVDDLYPLSPMQKGMLFHTLMAPTSGVYFEQMRITLQGELNIDALKHAWQQVVARHAILRTAFVWEGLDEPLQVVRQRVNLHWREQDWRDAPNAEQQLDAFLATEREQGFDLEQAPLMRCTILHLAQTRYYLIWSFHHLLLDGWSITIVWQEVWALYQAICQSQKPALPSPRPYKDYIAWLQQSDLRQAERFWRQILQGFNVPTPLVVDKRNTSEGKAYSEYQVYLSEHISSSLQKMARQNRLTINTLVQGAWALLLSRYNIDIARAPHLATEVLFGASISGRPPELDGIETMVGLFINTLPVRVKIFQEAHLLSWLQQMQQMQREREQYGYTPLVDIQGWSEVPRGTPLFESLLVFENYPVSPDSEQEDGRLQIVEFHPVEQTNYPLMITAAFLSANELGANATGPRLWFKMTYDTDRFDDAAIERMAGHFQVLLEGMAIRPETQITDLPLLTDKEHHQLLIEWNQMPLQRNMTTYADLTLDCFPQLFEAQVARTPDAVAVIFQDQSLTYRELNARANQLAHYLIELGVSAEVLVGICVERSLEMVIGLLGVLKAGGAYVPLDPSYPVERLRFMVSDSGIQILLTERTMKEAWPQNITQVYISGQWQMIQMKSESNPVNRVKPENLAYVIYTSGSTGKPKGVIIEHQSLTNFLHAMNMTFGLTANDKLLAVTTISFDIAALELYLPLIVGAKIDIASSEETSDGFLLSQKLTDAQVTIMQATPATWRMLLASGWNGNEIKIVCGGEALPQDLAQSLRQRGRELWNMYGPTEGTIWSTTTKVCKELASEPIVSIGRPLTNTPHYLLDQYLRLVPIGVPGELHIGGIQVARGYLNRPELTNEKFIPNPFADGRLYKTGDLCCYRPDGYLTFLGRIDHQIKIRGFRIELGEIEARLNQQEMVQQAVVLAQDEQLLAYVVPAADALNESQTVKQLEQWQQVWDETYRQSATTFDPVFNPVGWNDSYTGLPIPQQQMRDWLDFTVERIMAQVSKAHNILEIGCGTGMLLFKIAPHCASYVGTDISPSALRYIEKQMDKMEKAEAFSQVTLLHKTADDFDGIEQGTFDTIIMNSVIQYFPTVEYLFTVLEGALSAVAPGGCIFVGDVRHLNLLPVFQTSLQLHRVPAPLSKQQLHQWVQESTNEEQELLIAPDFFEALRQYFPQISRVETQLKRGHHRNEITRFRYDTIIHIKPTESHQELPVELTWLDWENNNLSLSATRHILNDRQPEILGIRGIPNARLFKEVQLLEKLTQPNGADTVEALRQETSADNSVEPEDWYALASELSYQIQVNWSKHKGIAYVDVLFQQQNGRPLFGEESSNSQPQPWSHYANNPLRAAYKQLTPKLRTNLATYLPNYMLPSHFIYLDAMPLTPNGKVNRRALPAPTQLRSQFDTTFVKPQTEVEQQIATVWQTVLQLDQVGLHDNFFDIGGNSLLIVQVQSQLRRLYAHQLAMTDLFQYPTVEALARYISQSQNKKQLHEEEANSPGTEEQKAMTERLHRRQNIQQRRQIRQQS